MSRDKSVKEDIQKEKTERIEKRKKRRRRRIQGILRVLIGPVIKRKFNYEFEDFSNVEGPYILLANHNENLDPVFLAIATKETLSYVSTENAVRNKLAAFFLNLIADVIIHRKGKVGFSTVLNMQKRLKRGDSVLIFPEGNRSFNGETLDVDYSALVMVSTKCRVPIVTYRFEGGYLTHPRWSVGLRRGKITGKLMNVYQPEELKSDPKNCADRIKEDLYTNAFEYQKQALIAYKGKRLALGMESLFFMCPECKEYGKLKTNDNHIFCECGLKYRYNEYGQLLGEDQEASDFTILDWDRAQRTDIEDRELKDVTFLPDRVRVASIGGGHESKSIKQSVIGVNDGNIYILDASTIESSEDKKLIQHEKLEGLSVFSRNTINAYYDGQQYEIKGDLAFNAVKYLYLYNKLSKGK